MTCSKTEINPCYKCGEHPQLQSVYDLWYIKCVRCERIEVNPRKKKVIENWNKENPLTQKLGTKTKEAQMLRRVRGEKRSIRVFKLSVTGNKVQCYSSIAELGRTLGVERHELEKKFKNSPTGKITIKGVTYAKDTTTTTPATTGGRRKKKI